jgi:hypothetical protein
MKTDQRIKIKTKLIGPFQFGPPVSVAESVAQSARVATEGASDGLSEAGPDWGFDFLRTPGEAKLKFLGIDGGSSGAYAATIDLQTWDVGLVDTVWDRGHRLLDVRKQVKILSSISADVGGASGLVAAYEQSRKNTKFGAKNNFVNGRNEEFWRVLLGAQTIRCCSVDPKTWQCACFKGIKPGRTKDRAREYIRRRCPKTDWLDCFNKAPREAIVDAMCIAIWCRDRYRTIRSGAIGTGDLVEEGGSLNSFSFEI